MFWGVFAKKQMTLFSRLICSPEVRLGRNNVHEIMTHPFFRGVDWVNIRRMESPFVPVLTSITDTSYFPTEDLDKVPDHPEHHGTSLHLLLFLPTNRLIVLRVLPCLDTYPSFFFFRSVSRIRSPRGEQQAEGPGICWIHFQAVRVIDQAKRTLVS